MPQYGAKNLQWAPFAASNPEPEDALPNYGTPIKLGDLMSVGEALNFSEVESRADDVRKIYLREFVDGSLAVGVLELPNETASAVTGAQIDSTEGAKDIHFSSNDTAPYGCLGFYTTNIKADGSKYYKGLFYPKVKASLDGRTYNTKQKTIVLDSPKLTFAVDACNTGDYRIESDELTTETAAKAAARRALRRCAITYSSSPSRASSTGAGRARRTAPSSPSSFSASTSLRMMSPRRKTPSAPPSSSASSARRKRRATLTSVLWSFKKKRDLRDARALAAAAHAVPAAGSARGAAAHARAGHGPANA